MKLAEAYKILDLSPDATPAAAKKQYRKLTKEFHPDVNKEPEAEAKFKKINEAYQIIQSGEETEPPSNPFGPSSPFNHTVYDIFNRNPFGANKRQYYTSNIEIQTTLSFKEAVQGCKKEITYSRQIKCPYCQGSGEKPINNGCKSCAGRGQVTVRQGNSIFIKPCPDCHGRSRTESCTECKNVGTIDTNSSVHVTIPAAVVDGNILRLQGMGHYSGTFMGLQDTYTDAFLRIKVIAEPNMRLEGNDVVSDVRLSLLDALRGCQLTVTSLDGIRLVTVDSGIKNKEEIVLSVGDHNNIKHRVIVHVDYPKNIDNLINTLSQEGN